MRSTVSTFNKAVVKSGQTRSTSAKLKRIKVAKLMASKQKEESKGHEGNEEQPDAE